VVLENAGLDRTRGFRVLGERIADAGRHVRTAGDLGTTASDLAAMVSRNPWVHTEESGLAGAVTHGLLRCIEKNRRAPSERM
jgi:hypothetical protein